MWWKNCTRKSGEQKFFPQSPFTTIENPAILYKHQENAPVVQWIVRQIPVLYVGGSSPSGRASSESPCTATFSPLAKTALCREFLRFQPRPASLGSRLGPPCGRLFYEPCPVSFLSTGGTPECAHYAAPPFPAKAGGRFREGPVLADSQGGFATWNPKIRLNGSNYELFKRIFVEWSHQGQRMSRPRKADGPPSANTPAHTINNMEGS